MARLKRDGTRAETRFGLSAKRTSPFKSAGVSVQSTTGSRGVRISGSNAGYTMFWGRVQDYWLPTTLACFPFTSPTVRHRVASRFNRALLVWLTVRNIRHRVSLPGPEAAHTNKKHFFLTYPGIRLEWLNEARNNLDDAVSPLLIAQHGRYKNVMRTAFIVFGRIGGQTSSDVAANVTFFSEDGNSKTFPCAR